MLTMSQRTSLRDACTTSEPVSWPVETVPKYPQASYYRARYYDPAAGRFLSEDPTTFEGGINFYDYVWNNASNLVDESGLDGHTRGPFTWYTNQGMSQAQINAERAHEKQHRCDFWNGNAFTKPCEFLESRGFAAEIPILQQQIQQLQQQKTLTVAEKQELQQLLDELGPSARTLQPQGARNSLLLQSAVCVSKPAMSDASTVRRIFLP